MFNPAAQGFGRVASSIGLDQLGNAPGRNFERALGLGSTSLRGKAAINAAKARGRAIEYAGRQDRNASIFGGAMSALGSIGSAGISEMGRLNQRYESPSFTSYPYEQLPPTFPGPVTPPTALPPVNQTFYGSYRGF